MSQRQIVTVAAQLGSECKRVQTDTTTNSVTKADDVVGVLAASAADGNVVAWSAANSKVTTRGFFGIFVDPDNELAGTPALNVLITPAAGTAFAVQVKKGFPLILGSGAVANAITPIGSSISTITVRNEETSAVTYRVLVTGT